MRTKHRVTGLLMAMMLASGVSDTNGAATVLPQQPFLTEIPSLTPAPMPGRAGCAEPVSVAAAPAGEGWAAAWVEAPSAAARRLVVRWLPREKGPGDWPLQHPITVVEQRGQEVWGNLTANVVSGPGGAWVLWSDKAGIRARWLDAATGSLETAETPVDTAPLFRWGVSAVSSTGDGSSGWVCWQAEPGLFCRVLRRTPSGTSITPRIALPATSAMRPRMAARSGKAMIAELGDQQSFRWSMVSDSGLELTESGGSSTLTLPGSTELLTLRASAGGFWIGISRFGGGSARELYTMRLSPEGVPEEEPVWRLSAEALTSHTGHEIIRTSGLLTAAPQMHLLFPDDAGTTFSPLPVQSGITALGTAGERRLILGAGSSSRGSYVAADGAIISAGSGEQDAPSLVWKATEALAAWQHETDDSSNEGAVRPILQAGGPAAVSLGDVSSPSLAVGGGYRFLAGRVESPGASAEDPDDVMGVIGDENGFGTPFDLGYGAGSQRAAATAYLSGEFVAVWREELIRPDWSRLYSVRMATVQVQPGLIGTISRRTLLASSEAFELSAPRIAESSGDALIVWNEGANIRGARLAPSGFIHQLQTFSPPGRSCSSPDVVWDGNYYSVAWREKDDSSISVSTGWAPSPVRVSGSIRSREPAVARLNVGRTAVFFLDHLSNRPSSAVYCSIVEAGIPSEPGLLLQGSFDRDILAAAGDGHGRTVIAVKDLAAFPPALRLFIVAPQTPADPGLNISPLPGSRVQLNWTPSVVFPGHQPLIQSSTDLLSWAPAADAVAGADFGTWQLPMSGPRRWFRLAPSLQTITP